MTVGLMMRVLVVVLWQVYPAYLVSPNPLYHHQHQHVTQGVMMSLPPSLPSTTTTEPLNTTIKGARSAVKATTNILATEHLTDCHLTILTEQHPLATLVAWDLSSALHAHQGFTVQSLDEEVLERESTWRRSVCDVYVIVVVTGTEFVQHANHSHYHTSLTHALWNYHAHYLLLLLEAYVEPSDMARLYNLAKTESVLILQPHKDGQQVLLWSHTLYPPTAAPTLLDSWRSDNFQRGNKFFPSQLDNLHGAVLTVATFHHPPSVVYIHDDQHEELVTGRLGVDMQIVQTLSQALNFTIEFAEVSHDELWGYELPNGTWVGLVGKVYNEVADIGACNVFLEMHRWKQVDYSAPYNFEHGCFVAPSPKPLLNWQSPAFPFSWDTWVSVGVCLLLGGVILRVLVALSCGAEPREFTSLSYSYLYMLGSLSTQPMELAPRTLSVRVYMGMMWLAGLILTTAYAANLVAFLSVTLMSQPVDTMQQLAMSGLQLGGHAFWTTQFAASIDSTVRSFVNRLETEIDLNALFDLVEDGHFALIENEQYLEVTVGARYTQGGRATIRVVPECLPTYSIGLALQKNSPLKTHLDPVILRLVEGGLVLKWRGEVLDYFKSLYAGTRTSRVANEGFVTRPLTLNQLQGVFYMLVLGYLGAAAFLSLELVLYSRHTNSLSHHVH
ncbi:hypothetical protein Pcinc_038595 [Petrolisthes cinctipes]|uniref:Uncharacterized protein n=1 Tax=Petrolisthes cinctipes TaxID=88211 RepID=A0AAE1BQ67_PETCI|nr:hypothetical protein Pcinc_038595 [Petrolisthes cinctipes]